MVAVVAHEEAARWSDDCGQPSEHRYGGPSDAHQNFLQAERPAPPATLLTPIPVVGGAGCPSERLVSKRYPPTPVATTPRPNATQFAAIRPRFDSTSR